MVLPILVKNSPRCNISAYADTIIPEGDVVLLPLQTDVEFLSGRDHLIEVANDSVALDLGNANNGLDEAWIEEQRLPAGYRVRSDNGVLRDDRFPPEWAPERSRAFGLQLG